LNVALWTGKKFEKVGAREEELFASTTISAGKESRGYTPKSKVKYYIYTYDELS
jgi:hypothetical protein